jgi:hypothetical protein
MKDEKGRDVPKIELRSLLEPGVTPKYEFEMDLCLKTTHRGRYGVREQEGGRPLTGTLQMEQARDVDVSVRQSLEWRSAGSFPKTSEAVLLLKVSHDVLCLKSPWALIKMITRVRSYKEQL